ncbi:hypothetical protein PJL15_00864 [Paenarthrobacter nitroguajacolicus]|nr:carbohydrate ABC transporter permease [Paenarthrobacter nitroguajacolicus]MDI2033764.1 hypothetical protein [Paenarthrobacter nitroguajacolicus]
MTAVDVSPLTGDAPQKFRKNGRRRFGADTAAIVIALIVAFPLFWMVLSAVKPKTALDAGDAAPYTLEPSLDSFGRVLGVNNFGQYFLNSVIVALVVVVLSTVLAFLAAVALTRYNFKMRTKLLIIILVSQMVPVEALTIPLFFLLRNAGEAIPLVGLNQLGSLVLVHVGFSIPFAIWMLRGFVAAVPLEVEEAARLDGASSFRSFAPSCSHWWRRVWWHVRCSRSFPRGTTSCSPRPSSFPRRKTRRCPWHC